MFSDADRELAEYASRHHGVFSLAEARQFSFSRDQIRERAEREWVVCHEGVFRIRGAPESWLGRLRAATVAAPFGAISHRSAAALYDLPGGRTDLVEVTCLRWQRARHPTLVVHESRRFGATDIGVVAGISVVRAERVVLDLASIWPSPNFLETVIQSARRKRLISFESTMSAFEHHARRGVRGSSALRIALERWSPESRATESDMETLLVQVLRSYGCPEPTTQFEVRDRQGALVARVDAAIPDWKIVIEYDSKQEHSDEFQISRDARRRNRIIGAGYAPLTARYGDLRDGGDELHREITETRLNWRRRVG